MMKRTVLILIGLYLSAAAEVSERVFIIKDPDKELSPYSGMTREHWKDCGKHLLEGAFSHVKDIEDPMLFPKVPGVSYPRKGYDKCSPEELSAAIFEGVARTINVAAPLIAEEPDLSMNGIKLADYYRRQLLKLTDPQCSYFIGWGDENPGPAQQTCELGNLALWFSISPEGLWDTFSKPEQDQIAKVMQSWAGGWTKTHNWRWFNVMMQTFLKNNGYEIDEKLMLAHIDHLLMLESGEGWFRDKGHDYYSSHVFQLYGAVWSRIYGRDHEPARAKVIAQQAARFMENYPMVFGRDGKVAMWGRSILYRMGASAAMSARFVDGGDPGIDAGQARRIASGALLQFVTHPDFLQNGVPSLGFYGHFEPAIQPYSCAASPFWMFMNFTALTLPADHSFWTAKETEGFWTKLGGKTQTTFMKGTGLLLANHGSTGETEFINGKTHEDDPSYCRLSYSTDFPWESTSNTGPTASEVTLAADEDEGKQQLPDHIDLWKHEGGVFYRQTNFGKDKRGGVPPYLDMADIVIPGGKISVRRYRKVSPATLYEGHYGLPHIGGKIEVSTKKIGNRECVIATTSDRSLALTNFSGWGKASTVEHKGQHPETEDSTLPYLETRDESRYGAPELLVSIALQKTGAPDWSDDELQPINAINRLDPDLPEALGGIKIILKTGEEFVVDFTGIDGCSSQ